MYKLLYPSISVRTGVLYRLGLRVSFSFTFSALKFITGNDCIAEGVPSVELVRVPDL